MCSSVGESRRQAEQGGRLAGCRPDGVVTEYGEYHMVLRDPEENEFCVQ
jgi:hypothetical protein